MKTRSLALLFLPLIASLGGCTVVVSSPDTDVRVDAYWTINSGAANSKSCLAVDVASVELVFYSSLTGGVPNSVGYVDCADGGFVTGWEYAADIYYYEWIAYDADGAIVFESDARTYLDMTAGGTAYIDVDFVLDQSSFPAGAATAIYGEFNVMGQIPTTTICQQADISWVEIVLRDYPDQQYEWTHDALWNYCDVGYIDSLTSILAADNYYYLYRAYNDANELVFESNVFTLLDEGVDTSTNYFTAATVDFIPQVHLWFDMAYETGAGSGFYTNCIGAGADSTYFTWTLWDRNPSDSSAVALYYAGATDILCPDQVQIDEEAVDLLLPGYTYYLEFYSTATVGTTWDGLCAIELDHAGYTLTTCYVSAT